MFTIVFAPNMLQINADKDGPSLRQGHYKLNVGVSKQELTQEGDSSSSSSSEAESKIGETRIPILEYWKRSKANLPMQINRLKTLRKANKLGSPFPRKPITNNIFARKPKTAGIRNVVNSSYLRSRGNKGALSKMRRRPIFGSKPVPYSRSLYQEIQPTKKSKSKNPDFNHAEVYQELYGELYG